MELSPEERKKIYQEEKARIDSQANAAAEGKKLLYAPEEIQGAIELGKKSKPEDILQSYSLSGLYYDVRRIAIATPYCLLAFSAAKKTRVYEELSKLEIEEIINSNQITFSVDLRGPEPTFATNVKAIVRVNDSIIRPIESECQELPDIGGIIDLLAPGFSATNQYVFPFDQLKSKQIELHIIPSYGPKRVIPIDLSKYK